MINKPWPEINEEFEMTTFSPVTEVHGPRWLLDVLDDSPAARRVHRWWQWVALSLGCLSGCATWNEFADTATQPLRATGNMMAQAGDRVGDLFESNSTHHRNPENLPSHQALNTRLAQQPAPQKAPTTSTTAQAGATSLPVSPPAAMQAIHKTPAATERPRESLSVPSAPPAVELQHTPGDVELLPAPPANAPSISNVQPISNSQPATAKPTVVTAESVKTWCRIRIRNVSQQAVPRVAVTVNSPEDVPLVSKDGESISPAIAGKMEFAPVPEVGTNEEIILIIGLATDKPKSNRLRVQVRDGLGGSNQDVQARWQVAIEAME